MLSTIDITDMAGSQVIEPAILYFGTPVVLVGSTNEDGSANLAPMSSAWWVGWRCMLGLASNSKTTENMIRTGECVLNLPSADLVDAVNNLARTTGSNPVPAGKIRRGYRHEKDKFEISGLTRLAGETVAAPRAGECPVQIEAKVAQVHEMAQEDEVWRGNLVAIEVRITRVHAHPGIMMDRRKGCSAPNSDKFRRAPTSRRAGDRRLDGPLVNRGCAQLCRRHGMTVIIVDEPTDLS